MAIVCAVFGFIVGVSEGRAMSVCLPTVHRAADWLPETDAGTIVLSPSPVPYSPSIEPHETPGLKVI